jgi:hypothetical protein
MIMGCNAQGIEMFGSAPENWRRDFPLDALLKA